MEHTGEASNGSYFWSSDLVIVPRPGIPAMTTAIEELARSQPIPSGDHDPDFLTDAELSEPPLDPGPRGRKPARASVEPATSASPQPPRSTSPTVQSIASVQTLP